MSKDFMKTVLIFLPLLVLAGCVSSPEVVKETYAYDQSFNCQQLDNEIRKTQQTKVAARADDHFKLSHINPVTGIWSMINMNRAESASQKRLDYLEQLRAQKQCSDNRMTPPYGMMVPPSGNPMTPPSLPTGMSAPYPYPSPMMQPQPQPSAPYPTNPSPGPSIDSLEIDMGL